MAEKLQEHYRQDYSNQIIKGLESQSVPKTPRTVKRMAELMQKNIQHGLELEPQHLAQLVREDYQRELASLIGGADAEAILSLFGEDLANKIRKHDLQKFKSTNNGFNQPKSAQPVQTQNSQPRKMRADEYEAYIKNKK